MLIAILLQFLNEFFLNMFIKLKEKQINWRGAHSYTFETLFGVLTSIDRLYWVESFPATPSGEQRKNSSR